MTDPGVESLGWFALRAFAAVFVIVDPLGNIPFFVTATGRFSPPERRALAWRAGLIAAAVLLLFALCGTGILRLLRVGFPALRIGGGVVLLVVALRILSGRQFAWEDDASLAGGAPPVAASAVVPLAIPFMAGPGAMTTVLVLVEQASSAAHLVLVALSIVVVCALGAFCYRYAGELLRRLGRTTIVTLSCLAGLLLAVIAVQFVLDGLRQAFPQLAR